MTELQMEHVLDFVNLDHLPSRTEDFSAVCTASCLCVRLRSCLQSLVLCIALTLERMVHKAAMGGGAVEPSTHCRGVWAHLLPSPFQGSVSKIGHCLRASAAAKAQPPNRYNRPSLVMTSNEAF